MAEALLITRQDVVKFTAMNGNVDTDNFIQYVKIAQDIHIQNFLGTDLLQKIQTDIINSSLSGDYLALLVTYVKPMLIHWAMVEYSNQSDAGRWAHWHAPLHMRPYTCTHSHAHC